MRIKLVIAFLMVLLLASSAYAVNKFWWATGYTGGGSSLDGIDGANLTDGDGAIVVVESAPGTYESAFYILDDSDAAASPPDIIIPTTNPGTKRWHKLVQGTGDVTGVGDCASGACGDGSSDGGTHYRLYNSGFYLQMASPTLAASRTFTFPAFTFAMPTADGTSGQCLKTYANGTSYFDTCSTGTGDITDVFNCATGDCAGLIAGATDYLDMAAATSGYSKTCVHQSDCSTVTGIGRCCVDTDTPFDTYIGNGTSAILFHKGNYVYNTSLYDNGNSGSSKTITWSNGNKQKITLTAACSIDMADPTGVANLYLEIHQDGTGSWTVSNWDSSGAKVRWPGGTP